jgi:cob(I)alamin adenosyltransferase
MRQGMIQIYCGDGKGKTTAATGLAVRAAGSGMKVLFARFLKNENSAELCVLDHSGDRSDPFTEVLWVL